MRASGKANKRRAGTLTAILLTLLMAAAMMLSGCGSPEAEEAVRADLESMRTIEISDDVMEELYGMMSGRAEKKIETFREMAGDFEYEIESVKKGSNGTAAVKVRITTYSFGREYLRTWSDYIEEHGDSDFDEKGFYDLLMNNLTSLELKTHDTEVTINCHEEDGEWKTDAETNAALRDAILGGMMTEIADLAGAKPGA